MKINRILLLFSLCLCATFVVAQSSLREFSVVAFDEKPFDTAARDERYRIIDGNGDLFSIIKLVAATPDDDLRAYSFDFGLPESRVKNVDGEVWVYVQRNAMRVTIRREGFKTVKYDLPVTVQPGQVFEMTLQATPRVIKKRYVLFKVEPADSKANIQYRSETDTEYRVFADGQIDDDGKATEKIPVGKYYYKITSKYYHISEGIIDLADAAEPYVAEVTLRPNYGELTLKSAANAVIYIDGEKVGNGFWSGKLMPGSYTVETVLEKHANSEEVIEVRDGERKSIALKEPTPITGSLDLSSTPLEADITIDGTRYGRTPRVVDNLLIGDHYVLISKHGYESKDATVTIIDGETAELTVVLEKETSGVYNVVEPKVDQAADTVTMHKGHEYVDLGLSVKWATCNIGASVPEEYGGYYAWGETESKKKYSWRSYKWCTEGRTSLTKYCADSRYAMLIDDKTELDANDDVAHVEWGGTWRIPTIVELYELYSKCKWNWMTKNGVNGYMVTGPNGKTIFLPAAGFNKGSEVCDRGIYGFYWSRLSIKTRADNAYCLGFLCGESKCTNAYRYYGFTVRPVCE